jgi:hypothetical protein
LDSNTRYTDHHHFQDSLQLVQHDLTLLETVLLRQVIGIILEYLILNRFFEFKKSLSRLVQSKNPIPGCQTVSKLTELNNSRSKLLKFLIMNALFVACVYQPSENINTSYFHIIIKWVCLFIYQNTQQILPPKSLKLKLRRKIM